MPRLRRPCRPVPPEAMRGDRRHAETTLFGRWWYKTAMRARPSRSTLVLSLLSTLLFACGPEIEPAAYPEPHEGGASQPPPVSPYYATPAPRPAANQGAVATRPPAPQPQPNTSDDTGAFKWDRVDPAFLGAVASYSKEVSDIIVSGEELDKTRRAVRLLAFAIEKIPVPPGVPVVETAAAMRSDADQLASGSSASMSQGAKRRTLKDALGAAAKQLSDLGAGTYRGDPKVAESAKTFQDAVSAISSSDAIWTNSSSAYRALQQAELALRAIQIAIASGRVTPVSATRTSP